MLRTAHSTHDAVGDPAQTMVDLTDVTAKLGHNEALRGISFSVGRGDLFALLGPNGAGKTTTIRILTTLLAPTTGTARLDGLDVVGDAANVRKRIGVVFQESTLDPELTAYENLEFHSVLYSLRPCDYRPRIDALLELFGMTDRSREPTRVLSGGMKRRIEVARGLLHKPAVLFLDEPTAGLDVQTRNDLWGHLKQLNQVERVTIILTTHYLEEAEKMANRIVILDRGRIVASGTPSSLKQQTSALSLDDAFLSVVGGGRW